MRAIRRTQSRYRALAAGVALINAAFTNAAADQPQAYEVDAGFDAAPQSLYWYSGGIAAVNGDMAKDGFLLRTYGSFASFQYATKAVAGIVDGTLWQLDVMPGYQAVRGSSTFGGYVGFDYQQAQLSPNDPTNQVNGTATGIKAEAHIYSIRMTSSRSRRALSANTRRPSTPTMPRCVSAHASSTSSSSVPTRRSTATPVTTRSGSAATPSTPSS